MKRRHFGAEKREVAGEIAVMQWNAQGLTNVRKNRKLWSGMDIVVFQETFLEEKRMLKTIETLDKEFLWFGKSAVRTHLKGRASGGQLVGIKKRLEMAWQKTEWEYGLQVEIKMKNSRDKYTLITGYNNKPANTKLFLKRLDQKMDEMEDYSGRIIVAGDLNARIGIGQGVAECGWEEDAQVARNVT